MYSLKNIINTALKNSYNKIGYWYFKFLILILSKGAERDYRDTKKEIETGGGGR